MLNSRAGILKFCGWERGWEEGGRGGGGREGRGAGRVAGGGERGRLGEQVGGTLEF